MTADDVVEVLDVLSSAGVEVWLDGGWGVDALLGRETRVHRDLDLAVAREALRAAEDALRRFGFQPDPSREPGLPARLVLVDPHGRQVDLHPLEFDDAGDGWQQLSSSGRAWGCYEAQHLRAVGTVTGREVRCISAELQMRFRRGYELSAEDEHDIRALAARFGLPLPPPFR